MIHRTSASLCISGGLAALLALAASACGGGSSTNTPTGSAGGVRSQSFKAAPTFSSTGYALGDTSTNPDSQYECAASGSSDAGLTIAYGTVAGNDNAEATQACAAMESSGAWSSVSTISSGSYEATPICHITTADTATTIRIYTAKPDGDDSLTTQLCAAMAQGFGAK